MPRPPRKCVVMTATVAIPPRHIDDNRDMVQYGSNANGNRLIAAADGRAVAVIMNGWRARLQVAARPGRLGYLT